MVSYPFGWRGMNMTKILIVEDEKPIANLIDWNLSASGYSCTRAYDGNTAADLIADIAQALEKVN